MRHIVTEEVAKFINLARTEQKISLSTLANCIGKSSAYLSNIENGKIKTITDLDLERILDCIVGTEENLRFFSMKKTDATAFLSRNSLNNNLILIFDYDLNKRSTLIPEKLIEYINVALKMIKTTRELLYMEVQAFQNPPQNWGQEKLPPVNKAFCFDDKLSVRIDIDYDYFEGILDKKIKKTTYTVLAAILLALRINMAKNAGLIQDENEDELVAELVENVHSTLHEFGFYSLVQISISPNFNNVGIEKHQDFAVDRKIDDLIRGINYFLRLYLESDSEEKLKELENITKNLQWNTSFWLKIATMPFFELEGSSYTHKKNLVNEIEGVLNDYINSPAELRNRDIY